MIQAQGMITLPVAELLKHAAPQELTRELIARIAPVNISTSFIPAIGEMWSAEGGINAGLVRGDDDRGDYYLIVCAQDHGDINYEAAMKWAAECTADGHKDFALPRRVEQAVMFGNVPELFQKTAYWSREQYAGNESCAWCQNFYDGYQGYYRKTNELRARAVRRKFI